MQFRWTPPHPGSSAYPQFRSFARAVENGGLADLVRMIRVESAEDYRARWQQTAETILKIESAPLAKDDDLELKGRRIFALDALLTDAMMLWDSEDRAYGRTHSSGRTRAAELPSFHTLLPRLVASVCRALWAHSNTWSNTWRSAQ